MRLRIEAYCLILMSLVLCGFCGITQRLSADEPDSPIRYPAKLTEANINDGWLALFDDETLFGWKAVTEANWEVKDETIQVDAGPNGLLRTTSQFDDFELTLEFQANERANSGIFLRTSPSPKSAIKDCIELNIASPQDHKHPTGSLVGRASSQNAHVADKWHHFRVVAQGKQIKVWLDGKLTCDHTGTEIPLKGYIGLQKKSGKVAFRKIALKPLKVQGLSWQAENGVMKDWKTDQKLDSEFQVTSDNELSVIGGKGQIETRRSFADFVFSISCKTNAAGLNSGVFFRCIPGEIMNGYESQIQNQFENNRDQPKDCGTGGIFRRVNSRWVNADDQTWFRKTIITSGPRMAVWVNGYQVTDWADSRKPHANPRKGLRLDAGTIIIQGHDPTTDLLFRDAQARELQPRR